MSTIYRMLAAASPAVFAFGALTFSTLAVFYWIGKGRARRGVFPVFTLVCAGSFLINLLLAAGVSETWLTAIGRLAVGLLPALVLNVVLGSRWRQVSALFYAGALAVAFGGVLHRAPAWELAAVSVAGLLFLSFSARPQRQAEQGLRRWIAVLLVSMLLCALASLSDAGPYVDQFADCLLLAFFGVNLYYRERLVFFDVLMKRGVYLALGLTGLTAAMVVFPDTITPWLYGIGMVFWFAGPWIYSAVAGAVDRRWLRRRYSVMEAERRFLSVIQTATSEGELRAMAEESLASIFQAASQIVFDGAVTPGEDGLSAAIEHSGACQGTILLAARPNGVPYLSDDRRLLQSLAAALGMALENVRFRADRIRQERREQELRLLASRAELKALRAQINPHFLFNSLSVIAGLMQSQPDLADETIERLSQVFRYTLRKSENEWAPLGEEIEFIEAYLGIEQARFGDRLTLEFDVDQAAAQLPIPAMSIQPLVENAVKHGVSAREGPGTVRVRAAIEDDRLVIEVSDTGPGFPSGFSLDRRGESHGLRNVENRLRGYYGDAGCLTCESDALGARVVLAFPVAVGAGDLK